MKSLLAFLLFAFAVPICAQEMTHGPCQVITAIHGGPLTGNVEADMKTITVEEKTMECYGYALGEQAQGDPGIFHAYPDATPVEIPQAGNPPIPPIQVKAGRLRWLVAVPEAVGRTYANMFTFKRPVLAVEQWASVGALVFDEKTTMDVFARCRGCAESGFFNSGQRYGIGTTTLNVVLAGTLYTTLEQVCADGTRNDPNWWSRNGCNVLTVGPVAYHTLAGVSNMGVRGDPPAVRQFGKWMANAK